MRTNTKRHTQKNKDADYESFLQGLQLVDLHLASSSSVVDREAFFALYGRSKKMIRSFRDEYAITTVGPRYFEAEGRFTLSVSESADSEAALRLEFAFSVHMHGTPPIWEEGAERFVESELRLILVPYARQFVTQMTGQMSIPPIILPLASDGG